MSPRFGLKRRWVVATQRRISWPPFQSYYEIAPITSRIWIILHQNDWAGKFFLHIDFLGSGPDRGRSPVEWGDFPSVRTFVPPSGPSSRAWGPASQAWGPASQPAKSQASGMAGWASGLAGWASGLAGWPRGGDGRTYGRTNVRTDEQTDGKSPHSTGLRPLLGPLPKNHIAKLIIRKIGRKQGIHSWQYLFYLMERDFLQFPVN